MRYELVLLPGDGVGPEVMAEGRKVIDLVCNRAGVQAKVTEIPCGGRYYLDHGRDWPEGSEQQCESADVIFLGAVGWPSPQGGGPVRMRDGRMAGWSAVLGNRSRLDLFANIRPIRLLPGIQPRIHGRPVAAWEPRNVDLVIVRENTEGLYSGMGGVLETGGERQLATDTRVVTRRASERIIRRAFELAVERGRGAPLNGRKRVTCVSKSNVLYGCRLFDEVFDEIGRGWPEVEREHMLLDAFAASLIVEPERYDVCVTTNLFGDVLTDIGAVLQGGMGMAVGCNVGDDHGMFEPVHGSAPSIAGSNRANPMAMVMAVGQGLGWLGRKRSDDRLVRGAAAIAESVAAVASSGSPLTFDVAGDQAASGTAEVGALILGELDVRLGSS